MPTWRDWLRNRDDVRTSDFFARWDGLLHSPEFWAFLEANDLVADLYLHANLQAHADLFDLTHVNVVRHGDVAIQDLLLRSMAVVTDYTSAAIDFSFLDRPVFYYQFDRTRFLGRRPSTSTSTRSCPARSSARAPSCSGSPRRGGRARLHHPPGGPDKSPPRRPARDQREERIVQAARHPAPTTAPPSRARRHQSVGRLTRRVKRRRDVVALPRVSGPVHKALYRVARRLPRSGLPFREQPRRRLRRQPRGDPPRLTPRGLTVRTAWVTAPDAPPPRQPRPQRPTTPLPVGHGRASVWVTNQNKPAWMRRPAGTYDLQTWHGTPLKRMLHDLDTVVGRDIGLRRVGSTG